ncbi:MAG: nucleoside triphosphate pyrophosphohydrolase [Mycolicibacterium sp.]|nr:nucleoside triphosphate pyrophosphohydrolase [Mycolicibacterium sp.]
MTVILVDARRPGLVPVEAIGLLTGPVHYTEELPPKVVWALPSARPVGTGDPAPVLLSSNRNHPEVRARLAAGEPLIAVPEPVRGERLLEAVEIMDRLRSNGPWESTQTHDSLGRYLLEETYELFDAVRGGDAEEVRGELGDVLLQVLFHARIAEDSVAHPFDIDDVAAALIRKLVNRVPAVLAGEEISLEDQLAQWEERKAAEKVAARGVQMVGDPASMMDGLPTATPALLLAQKVIARAEQAGMPVELIPSEVREITVTSGVDAEIGLRSAVLAFMDDVRSAERAIGAGRGDFDGAAIISATPEEWRAAWPSEVADAVRPEELRD